MSRRAHPFDVPQHEKVKAFHLVTRPGRFAQKLQAGGHAGLALKTANRDALAQLIPAVMRRQGCDHRFQSQTMQRVAQLLRAGPGHFTHLFFSLPRSGTWVTMVGRTASGDTDLGGEVSFFGFLTILLVFC